MPEPDMQPTYTVITRPSWKDETDRDFDDSENVTDNKQLIENDENDISLKQEPYMRASRTVSSNL